MKFMVLLTILIAFKENLIHLFQEVEGHSRKKRIMYKIRTNCTAYQNTI